MEYRLAVKYMEKIAAKGSVFTLDAVKELLKRLGNPQNQVKVIHVAGTNGKGSICTFLSALYEAEGKRVGRYISPTIQGYLERFQINGTWMSENTFGAIFKKVFAEYKHMEESGMELPTAFEMETVIAFCYFLEQKVDLVVLETGMGGRTDATNVVEHPLCTVFSSIALDHMQFLGDTVEQIAEEKAGIMREGCPVIAYPSCEDAIAVLRREAGLHNAKMIEVDEDKLTIVAESLEGSTFVYDEESYEIGLAGDYQIYNAIVAILCKQELDGQIHKEALTSVKWEGRFEKVFDNPLVIKDGAHNIDGVNALAKSVRKHFTNYRIIFIIGVLRDKAYQAMMETLCPMAEKVYTITPNNPRGLDKEELKECVAEYCNQVVACENIEDAMAQCIESFNVYKKRGEKAVIIAWGSLSYIGTVNASLIKNHL